MKRWVMKVTSNLKKNSKMGLKKDLRNKFKKAVFLRDNNTCQVCGNRYADSENFLNAHHITDRHDMPNGGYVKENGITVCENICHLRVEKYHITGGKEWEDDLHPRDLYRKIGSSLELATKKSEELCQ